jgi:hypothetical protein
MTITIPEEVWVATDAVITAAGWVVNSYRPAAGYSVPLSINLRSLAKAIDAWRTAMYIASLDSDTNGFDRSAVSPGKGDSNEQSTSEADTQRRGCAKASNTKAQE